ncbi:hypothetical protein [Bacillus sp. NPDC094106]|uniref:hypothetical protein n=1 Tax=Bacillus sp. NPDC094106 TaxID=3363949 RepID=UPI00381C5857
MKQEFEGKVTYERTSDTGDPRFDFDYTIGYNSAPSIEELLSRYEGKQIKMTISIEEIDENEGYDED